MPPEINRFQAAIISRLKIMARLNIAERRLPQDGRIQLKVAGREVDVRVSVIPMIHGEGIVLRLLDKGGMEFSLSKLGMEADLLATFRELIRLPHGIILVTGPTGSGKTTTLYSALLEIRDDETKIITTEDPVEYQLDGINQIQVHPKIGLTFGNSLRSILRHDPDIVLVGEIRDLETAENAIQASLTGHLVFSTLHTNDAAGGLHAAGRHGRGAVPGLQHGRGGDGPAPGAHALPALQRALSSQARRPAARFPLRSIAPGTPLSVRRLPHLPHVGFPAVGTLRMLSRYRPSRLHEPCRHVGRFPGRAVRHRMELAKTAVQKVHAKHCATSGWLKVEHCGKISVGRSASAG